MQNSRNLSLLHALLACLLLLVAVPVAGAATPDQDVTPDATNSPEPGIFLDLGLFEQRISRAASDDPLVIEDQAVCYGNLGAFVNPACRFCNGLELTCEQACSSHGGVDHFECIHQQGVECICNDATYDSCTCSAILP